MLKEFFSPYICLFKSRTRIGLSAWIIIIGMVAALKAFPPIFLAIKSLIAMLAIAMSVYIYNDILDIELDKISAKAGNPQHINRPLVTGRASKLDAKIFVLVQTVIGLGLSFFINFQFFFLLALYLMLGILYSTPPIHLKDRFLLKQLTVAIGQAISCLAGGAAVGVISKQVIYLAALFFTLTFGVVPITDLRDMYGDKKMGRKTLPVVMGPKATIKITVATIVVTLFVSVLGYSWLGFNFAFVILMFASLLMMLLSIFKIYKNLNNSIFIENIIRQVLRPIFLILQISILVGLIPL